MSIKSKLIVLVGTIAISMAVVAKAENPEQSGFTWEQEAQTIRAIEGRRVFRYDSPARFGEFGSKSEKDAQKIQTADERNAFHYDAPPPVHKLFTQD